MLYFLSVFNHVLPIPFLFHSPLETEIESFNYCQRPCRCWRPCRFFLLCIMLDVRWSLSTVSQFGFSMLTITIHFRFPFFSQFRQLGLLLMSWVGLCDLLESFFLDLNWGIYWDEPVSDWGIDSYSFSLTGILFLQSMDWKIVFSKTLKNTFF